MVDLEVTATASYGAAQHFFNGVAAKSTGWQRRCLLDQFNYSDNLLGPQFAAEYNMALGSLTFTQRTRLGDLHSALNNAFSLGLQSPSQFRVMWPQHTPYTEQTESMYDLDFQDMTTIVSDIKAYGKSLLISDINFGYQGNITFKVISKNSNTSLQDLFARNLAEELDIGLSAMSGYPIRNTEGDYQTRDLAWVVSQSPSRVIGGNDVSYHPTLDADVALTLQARAYVHILSDLFSHQDQIPVFSVQELLAGYNNKTIAYAKTNPRLEKEWIPDFVKNRFRDSIKITIRGQFYLDNHRAMHVLAMLGFLDKHRTRHPYEDEIITFFSKGPAWPLPKNI